MCITCQLRSQAQSQDGNIGQEGSGLYDAFIAATGASDGLAAGTTAAAATSTEITALARYLTHGFWQDRNDVAHAFDKSAGSELRVDITKLTDAGKTLARAALAEYAALLGFTVVETTTNVDIDFDDRNESTYTAYAFSSVSNTNLGDNVYKIDKSYVVIGTNWIDSSMGDTIGSYGYQTYIHEIGHALGLGHAGNYNGSASYPGDATFSYDSWQTSVMSYFAQSENTTTNASLAYVTTLQWADIEAVKALYGLSGTTRTGDTVYGYNSTAGSGYSMSTPGAYGSSGRIAFSIVDDGGTDTLDGSGTSAAQTFDLRGGTYSSIGGYIENVFIYTTTLIEKALGGSGADLFRAGSGNHEMRGNGGNDTFEVGHFNTSTGGNNTVYGGNGTDTVKFGYAIATYALALVGDFITFTYQGMTSVYKDVETFVLGGTSLTRDQVLTYLTPVLIDEVGDVVLKLIGSQYMLEFNGSNIAVTASGTFVGPTSYSGWTAVASEELDSGGFKLLWQHTDGSYFEWTLDALGVRLSGQSVANVQDVEGFYGSDFDGDNAIGVAMTTIESNLKVTLKSTPSQYFVNDGSGDVGITSGGTAVGPSRYAGWQIIQAEADGSNYKVLWMNSSGSYAMWTLNSSGAFVSSEPVENVQIVEDTFGADLDGDNAIGVAMTTIESNGGVTLKSIPSQYFVNDGSGDVGITSGGTAVGPSRYAGWQIIQAEADGSNYKVLWMNSSGSYAMWTLNSSGAFVSSEPVENVQIVEDTFGVDIDGDNAIGVAMTTIESNGGVTLKSIPSQYFVNDGSGDVGITSGGTAVGPSRYAGWQIIQAEADGSNYKVLWMNSSGSYAMWTLSSSGAFVGSEPVGNVQIVEDTFGVDIDGDNAIGVAMTTIESNLKVTLKSTPSQYFVNDGSGDVGITSGGTAVGPSRYAGWQIIQAEADGSNYKVLWMNSSGSYAIWTLNSSGAFVSSEPVGNVQIVEDTFGADIDGDNAIGVAMTTIESNLKVTLKSTPSQYFVNDGSGDVGITSGGTAVGPSRYAGWQIIQAEVEGANYKVLWKNVDGSYAIWTLNSSGAFVASEPVNDVKAVEATFGADIDGDNSIGQLPVSRIFVLEEDQDQAYAIEAGDPYGLS